MNPRFAFREITTKIPSLLFPNNYFPANSFAIIKCMGRRNIKTF